MQDIGYAFSLMYSSSEKEEYFYWFCLQHICSLLTSSNISTIVYLCEIVLQIFNNF